MKCRLVTLLVCVSLASAGSAFAQGTATTSTIASIVVDSAGGVVPGAEITIKHNATRGRTGRTARPARYCRFSPAAQVLPPTCTAGENRRFGFSERKLRASLVPAPPAGQGQNPFLGHPSQKTYSRPSRSA